MLKTKICMKEKKIGILGSGEVGQVLASGFFKHNYQVMIGTNDLAKLTEVVNKNDQVQIGTYEEASRFGDIIVLAIKGDPAEALVKSLHENLSGKTVIDTTNPIAKIPPINGVLRLSTTLEDSWMERLQRLAPSANFVKAFNYISNDLMVNPTFSEGRATMFICGNDYTAKTEVTQILDQFGWDAADFGKVESARAIEPLCMLWALPGFLNNQWNHAFKWVK
jgi:predicted dinucleotide-binding enzyme